MKIKQKYTIFIAVVRKHYIPKGGTKIHPAMKKQKKVIPRGGTKFCLKRTEPERTYIGPTSELHRSYIGAAREK